MKKKKNKHKSVITRRIWKSARKMSAVFLVLALFSSAMVMQGTNAGFLDEEKSTGNILAVTTLDFSVSDASDFSPKVSPSKETLRTASISKTGLSNFEYRISAGNFSGDSELCDELKIKDDLDDSYEDLNSYVSSETDNLAKTNWNFTIKLTDNNEGLADKTCNFDLKFEAWQDNLVYGAGGFTDIETLSSKIDSEHWTNIADHLVVNEVYYDADSSHGAEPDNEWVELYNPTDSPVNLKNWRIYDNYGNSILSTSDLYIPANGYAVITKSVSTWNYWTIPGSAVKIVLGTAIGNSGLRNDGDRVILKDPSGMEIDKMSYGDDTFGLDPACMGVSPGHSLARKPAGQDLDVNSDFENLSSPNPGTNPHTVVMNEIMPNPVGEDNASMPGGEWLELYNYGEYSIDLKDWVLKDKDGNTMEITDGNTSSESTVIAGGERLVVYRNGDKDFDLNDDGDEVQLIDEKGLIKDAYTFDKTTEGKSIARFPDAVGPWIDPEAKPGEENKLSEEETDAFRLATFDACFDGKGKLEKNSKKEICAPEFLKYLGMIKKLDDDKIDGDAELKILEMKKADEEKKLATLLKETENMQVDQNVSTGGKNATAVPKPVEENILSGTEATDTGVASNGGTDLAPADVDKPTAKEEKIDNTITDETNGQN